jgi:tetratricopeptide (TPR) repeat protein
MNASPSVSYSRRGCALLSLLAFACGTPGPEAPPTPPAEEEARAPRPPGEVQEPLPEDVLRRRAETLQLEQQKRAILVENHLELAREHLDALRFEEAEAEARAALSIDPDSVAAKDLLAKIGALLGRRPEEIETYRQEIERRWDLRVQSLRAEAEDAIQRGQDAMERGEFDRAAQ